VAAEQLEDLEPVDDLAGFAGGLEARQRRGFRVAQLMDLLRRAVGVEELARIGARDLHQLAHHPVGFGVGFGLLRHFEFGGNLL